MHSCVGALRQPATGQRILTWTINKISRTILKASFVALAYVLTGKLVISAFAILSVSRCCCTSPHSPLCQRARDAGSGVPGQQGPWCSRSLPRSSLARTPDSSPTRPRPDAVAHDARDIRVCRSGLPARQRCGEGRIDAPLGAGSGLAG